MNRTNFDRYLDQQLKDPAFAARFRDAARNRRRKNQTRPRARRRAAKSA